MIKNEKFYGRAQELRDNSVGLFRSIVVVISSKVFENGDTFPKNEQFIFAVPGASLELVKDVLKLLGIAYTAINQYGDYFLLTNAKFID